MKPRCLTAHTSLTHSTPRIGASPRRGMAFKMACVAQVFGEQLPPAASLGNIRARQRAGNRIIPGAGAGALQIKMLNRRYCELTSKLICE